MRSLEPAQKGARATRDLNHTNHQTAGKPEEIPPAWRALIEYCRKLQHGEIERLRIQDGLPVLAEVITQKVKFTR